MYACCICQCCAFKWSKKRESKYCKCYIKKKTLTIFDITSTKVKRNKSNQYQGWPPWQPFPDLTTFCTSFKGALNKTLVVNTQQANISQLQMKWKSVDSTMDVYTSAILQVASITRTTKNQIYCQIKLNKQTISIWGMLLALIPYSVTTFGHYTSTVLHIWISN